MAAKKTTRRTVDPEQAKFAKALDEAKVQLAPGGGDPEHVKTAAWEARRVVLDEYLASKDKAGFLAEHDLKSSNIQAWRAYFGLTKPRAPKTTEAIEEAPEKASSSGIDESSITEVVEEIKRLKYVLAELLDAEDQARKEALELIGR